MALNGWAPLRTGNFLVPGGVVFSIRRGSAECTDVDFSALEDLQARKEYRDR
jgi:hypothetical protein